jgi:Secretion system C-terminal sorting domain
VIYGFAIGAISTIFFTINYNYMKTTLAIGIMWLALCCGLSAQSSGPAVVAAGGGISAGGLFQLEWTLGEATVTSTAASKLLLTEGFHQPSLEVEPVVSTPFDPAEEPAESPDDPAFTATIYPNPVASELTIHFGGGEKFGGAQVELLSAEGKTLSSLQLQPGQPQATLQMGEQPPGLYFLRCRPDNYRDDGRSAQTFKVTKF